MLRAAPACVVLLLAWSAAHAASPALTVYSRDLAFVREARTLALKGGSDTLQLAGVPDRIDFASARLIPSGSARATRLAYRLDAASGNELIDRARGARVRVTLRGDRALEGTLVAADDAWLTVNKNRGLREVRWGSPAYDAGLSTAVVRSAPRTISNGGGQRRRSRGRATPTKSGWYCCWSSSGHGS